MGKTALITGASGGIGYALAEIHAAKGGDLVLVARSGEKLDAFGKELETKYRIKVHSIVKDLSLPGAAYDIYNKVNDLNIVIDYLINNAGFGDFRHFAESDWPKQEKMINLNVIALTHLTRLFLPHMIARGDGRILNVASVASFCPGPTMSVYFATKAYVLSFSQALAEELEGKGITITALCPGPVETNFHEVAVDGRKTRERKMPTSMEVAEYGYRMMLKGKRIAVHSFAFRLFVFMLRFLPVKMVTKAVRNIQEGKHN